MIPIEESVSVFVDSVFENNSLTSEEKNAIIKTVMLNMTAYLAKEYILDTNAMISEHTKHARKRKIYHD